MPESTHVPQLGAWRDDRGLHVRAYAPEHRELELTLFDAPDRVTHAIPMTRKSDGFFYARIEPSPSPLLYAMRIDGEGPFPDPWSRAQPFGVLGPSSLPEPDFAWTDAAWRGRELADCVLYEVHVGTATREGTFEALIPLLPALATTGINALELLPVAGFPGTRNWGYDGVALFAPSHAYGGPEGLKKLVDAAHAHGIAVVMDVVYNHFGPAGNFLSNYATSYFTAKEKTPWGDAINYSGSPVARAFALRNARMWIEDYHVDGLRLDATHAIRDDNEPHLLRELAETARAAAPHKSIFVTAEDERNDVRLITPVAEGGYGLDAVWADDFHHHMRRAFAGDSEGYFRDFTGSAADLATTLNDGWFFQGQVSKSSGKPRGTVPRSVPATRFVHCIQNHDQVGNRPLGNRLTDDVSSAAYRAMSAMLVFSPYTVLLFAGQEWGTRRPFLFFTDHDPELGKLVTQGRREEFKDFMASAGEEVPDPQAETTFTRSKLDWDEARAGEHEGVLALYRELLTLRRSHPALVRRERESFRAWHEGETIVMVERTAGEQALLLVVCIRDDGQVALPPGDWTVMLHSEEARFGGSGDVRYGEHKLALQGPVAVLLQRKVSSR